MEQIDTYFQAWNETDDAVRRALLERCMTADVELIVLRADRAAIDINVKGGAGPLGISAGDVQDAVDDGGGDVAGQVTTPKIPAADSLFVPDVPSPTSRPTKPA